MIFWILLTVLPCLIMSYHVSPSHHLKHHSDFKVSSSPYKALHNLPPSNLSQLLHSCTPLLVLFDHPLWVFFSHPQPIWLPKALEPSATLHPVSGILFKKKMVSGYIDSFHLYFYNSLCQEQMNWHCINEPIHCCTLDPNYYLKNSVSAII